MRRRAVEACVLGLALSSMIGNAWAGDVCARAQDLTALQVAAVQQELMVAALSCNDAGLYNTFVITYQKDLQASDATLKAFFSRLAAESGKSDYDSFKTKLANDSSLRSSRNARNFCRNALTVFRSALNEDRKSLASFALTQPIMVDRTYQTCGDIVAGGAMAAQIAAAPPAPEPPKRATATAEQRRYFSKLDAEPSVAPPPSASPPSAPPPAIAFADDSSSDRNVDNPPDLSARSPDAAPPRPPQSSPPRARTYQARDPRTPPDPYARDPYSRPYGDSYGYSNRYGERDPYYRNPYSRYWYGVPPQFYLRRR